MKMYFNLKLMATFIFCFLTFSQAWSDEGSCDASIDRIKKIVQIKADSYSRSGETITITEACDTKVSVIRTCSVIGVQKKQLQKYCFPEDGTPAYYDIYDVIEYYEAEER